MITLKDKVEHVLGLMAMAIEASDDLFFPEMHNKVPKVKEVYKNEQGQPVVVFEFDTESGMRNHMNNVHGGALTTILDWYSSMAVVADERYWSDEDRLPNVREIISFGEDMGLSRSLKSQFLRPVPLNDSVYLECKVLSNTKKNSCISMVMMDSSGKVLYEGIHDKIKLYKPINSNL